MSVVDWICKKTSLESASEQLSAITISRQKVLPSKLDACANVTTCCSFRPVTHHAKSFATLRLRLLDFCFLLKNSARNFFLTRNICSIFFFGFAQPPPSKIKWSPHKSAATPFPRKIGSPVKTAFWRFLFTSVCRCFAYVLS